MVRKPKTTAPLAAITDVDIAGNVYSRGTACTGSLA